MDIGELMLNLLGGEDDGLMLSEEPRRERRLLLLSRSSSFPLGILIQAIFSGILRCGIGRTERCGTKRGGGGRGGGGLDTQLVALRFWLKLVWMLLSCSSVFLPRLLRSLLSGWVQTWRLLSQECWVSLLLESWLFITASSIRPCFIMLGLWSLPDRWTLMKSGLMKHSAPLDWQHSSSAGVRVWSQGHTGAVAKETGLWAGGSVLFGAADLDKETESFLWHNWASQKPVWDSERTLVRWFTTH